MIMTNRKPIIGITLDVLSNSAKYQYSLFPWYALRRNYADSVARAGGVPVMIPCQIEAIDDIVDFVDGLIVPGCDLDINPKFYDKVVSDKTKTMPNDEKVVFELALVKRILDKNIPFLGICHGMQLMNVVLGGDLIQHIPDYIKSEINHEQPVPKDVPSHLIKIKKDTLLAEIAKDYTEILVNSTHHQAVNNLGEGIIVSATAPDGIIEAIELPANTFALGVEWHPEYLHRNQDLDIKLFDAIVAAATFKNN